MITAWDPGAASLSWWPSWSVFPADLKEGNKRERWMQDTGEVGGVRGKLGGDETKPGKGNLDV